MRRRLSVRPSCWHIRARAGRWASPSRLSFWLARAWARCPQPGSWSSATTSWRLMSLTSSLRLTSSRTDLGAGGVGPEGLRQVHQAQHGGRHDGGHEQAHGADPWGGRSLATAHRGRGATSRGLGRPAASLRRRAPWKTAISGRGRSSVPLSVLERTTMERAVAVPGPAAVPAVGALEVDLEVAAAARAQVLHAAAIRLAPRVAVTAAHAGSLLAARSLALRARGLDATSSSLGSCGWAPDVGDARLLAADADGELGWAGATASLSRQEALDDAVLEGVVADDAEAAIGLEQLEADSSAAGSVSSSRLTSIRSAWKTRVAGMDAAAALALGRGRGPRHDVGQLRRRLDGGPGRARPRWRGRCGVRAAPRHGV